MFRLKDEKYLEKNGKTIKSIVEGKVIEFENGQKRVFDITNDDFNLEPIYIDDLKPSLKKGLFQNRLNISKYVSRILQEAENINRLIGKR